MVDRHTCTPWVKLPSIPGKQTGRDPGWKPMSKIRWPIYQMHNASSGHKGHTGRYPSASRLSISIQNQYGVSRWCVNTKGPEAIPLWPSLQLLLVSKPTKRREDRPILASIPCLWKLWAVRGWPSWRLANRISRKCRPIDTSGNSLDVVQASDTCLGFLDYILAGFWTDRWLICEIVGFNGCFNWLQGIICVYNGELKRKWNCWMFE